MMVEGYDRPFEDILFDLDDGIATITINRPDRMNAFRPKTVEEMIIALDECWRRREIGVVVITGAGDRAFCAGGDLSDKDGGGYGGRSRSSTGIDTIELYSLIRDIPKPVIAAVNGYAIGGGHVLHVVCDLSYASETAIFGQVGPKVGSADVGFGTAYLSGVVGEKRAREIWFRCLRYGASEALAMGLVNAVVPAADLSDYVNMVCREILDLSPTALAFLKTSFTAASEHIRGLSALGMAGVGMFYGTEESAEGSKAFLEKRPPNFRKYRR
jgi:dihydroxynaphthoic acid synthetase